MDETEVPLGDFAIFGVLTKTHASLETWLKERLDITPQVRDFGTGGQSFFYTTYGEVAETHDAIAFKIGFLRTQARSPLSARALLTQQIVIPTYINGSALRGNGLVACFSKTEPTFSVYQTLLALPQLYYAVVDEGVICTTNLRCLLRLRDQVELNEDALAMHFLFQLLPGPTTYFKDIHRLFPGQLFRWQAGQHYTKLIETFRLSINDPTFDRLNTSSLETLHDYMAGVMDTYLHEVDGQESNYSNLLSGGVDSAIIQLLINEKSSAEAQQSCSFAMQTPDFQFEIDYAKQASERFQTNHQFFHIAPQDYPAMLTNAIDVLGQPTLYNEGVVCNLALARFLATNQPDTRFFFNGQAADALHGIAEMRKVTLFERTKHIPGASSFFLFLSMLARLKSQKKAHGLREVAKMLAQAKNPNAFVAPLNRVALAMDVQLAQHYFGDESILNALELRRDLEEDYLGSRSTLEKVQMIDLLTEGYEPAVSMAQLFAAHHKQLIAFYLDEDIIKIILGFDPRIRFIQGLETKPLQRYLLERRALTTFAEQKKGGTTFSPSLLAWMQQGPLKEMVQAIDRPDFMSKSEFERTLKKPTLFLWNLLTFDIFKKRLL